MPICILSNDYHFIIMIIINTELMAAGVDDIICEQIKHMGPKGHIMKLKSKHPLGTISV